MSNLYIVVNIDKTNEVMEIKNLCGETFKIPTFEGVDFKENECFETDFDFSK